MSPSPLIGDYLAQLESSVGTARWLPGRRRLLREVADHLEDATAELTARGLSPEKAAAISVERLGPASVLAQQWLQQEITIMPLGIKLVLATTAAFTSFAAGMNLRALAAYWDGSPLVWLRLVPSLVILATGLTTLFLLARGRVPRSWLKPAVLLCLAAGIVALFRGWTGPDPEYFIPLIGTALIAQSAATLLSMKRGSSA